MSDSASRGHVIRFAAVLSLVCGMLITGASVSLKGLQQENMAVDRQKNILLAGRIIDSSQALSSEKIKKLFSKNISQFSVDASGNIHPQPGDSGLTIYIHKKKGTIESYIIPIDSKGLWGKINGYMAIAGDGETIVGFSIYNHSETPGLGGEIEKQWFLQNFAGKKIVNRSGRFVSVSIEKSVSDDTGDLSEVNSVDGISGATLTGKYLTSGIQATLEQYEPLSVRFRQGDSIPME